MNGLDYVIIGIIGLSGLIGLMRGFTKEALSLLTWSGAGMSTYILFPVAKGFSLHYIKNPMVADALTMFVVFVVSLIVFSLIANSVAGFVRNSALNGADRGLGLGFGALRGLVLVCAAEIVFSTFTPRDKQSPTIMKAKFIHPVRQGSDQLMGVLPTHVQSYIHAQSHGLNKTVKEHMHDQVQKSLHHALPSDDQSEQPHGQTLAPGSNSADTGVLIAMPQISGMGGMSVPGQTTNTAKPTPQSVPQDPNQMMESLAQLKIRNEEVLDEKQASDTKYNSHELDRLVTVTNDEDKVKSMPQTATRSHSSRHGNEEDDDGAIYESHEGHHDGDEHD